MLEIICKVLVGICLSILIIVALYTTGSEGTLLCNDCSNLITEFTHTMSRYFTKQKVQKYRDEKLKEKV